MPPSAIVSVPVPKLPMFTPELLLQVEPAPVTVTVPCEPAPLPMLAAKAVLLMTLPPFAIVSVPVPKLPILSPPPGPLFQLEPGPVTVTVPVEPADCPTEPPPPLFTVPPFWMVSVPVPRPPTTTLPVFVQVEPAPVTVTVPSAPGKLPTAPEDIGHCPAGLDRKHPRPVWTDGQIQGCPTGSLTTVGFGVTVLMLALVPAVGNSRQSSCRTEPIRGDLSRPVRSGRAWMM